ncbi:transposase [Mesorhizobium erdmanii]|uniref:transposase n=1 Tax=Mesorhizobium erdmanii TaxID=1777866 RepID=UPI0009DDEF11
MERFVLTDAQWAKMEPHCLGKPADPGRSGGDNRRFIEALLWIVRTGSPWRDLPAFFGSWNTVFKRYRDWVKADVSWTFWRSVLSNGDAKIWRAVAQRRWRSTGPHSSFDPQQCKSR